MFVSFFLDLRRAGLPVSLTEYLTLLEALKRASAIRRSRRFIFCRGPAWSKTSGTSTSSIASSARPSAASRRSTIPCRIPEEWLRKLAEKFLSPEEMAKVQSLGGFEALMERLRQLLQEQKERHQGGNRFIGTAGTSPFGAYGYNPEGIRIGQDQSRHRKAVKVWDRREFRNLDDDVEVGVRNIQVALRRLRKFARTGAATELDLPGTISATAKNAGYLRSATCARAAQLDQNPALCSTSAARWTTTQACAELFTACRPSSKHLEHFYFHNCVYESLWRDNGRRYRDRTSTLDVLRPIRPTTS